MGLGSILLYLLTGAAAGTLAGMVGVGGGILYVPVLVYSLSGWVPADLIPQVTVSTSLSVITCSLVSSAYTHYKSGNMDLSPLPGLALGGILGSISASFGLELVDSDQFKLLLGLFEFFIAIQLITGANDPQRSARPAKQIVFFGIGLFGGLLSAFFGVGGGLVVMPLMHFLAGYPIKRAVGSASIYMILVALVGLLAHAGQFSAGVPTPGLWHQIYLPGFLGMLPTAFVFNRVGALWVNQVQPKRIKQGVGALLLFLAGLNSYFGFLALG